MSRIESPRISRLVPFARLLLALTAAGTLFLSAGEASAQFRFGGGGGGFRIPFGGGQIQPRNFIPSRKTSTPSLPQAILQGGGQNRSGGIAGQVAGQVAGSLFNKAVQPNAPQVAIPGLGDLFVGSTPSNPGDVPPLPSPVPRPKKKSAPEILIPLLLNPPPFPCAKPPCPPRPVQPLPVQPSPVQPIETQPGEPAQPPQSEIQQLAAAAKRAFQADDFAKALELANRMNDLAPKNGGVLQFRAAVYSAQMKYAEAAIDTYNAILAGPIWTKVNIKDVYGDPDKYQRDVKWLRSTTADQPDVLAHQFLSAYHAHVAQDWSLCRNHLQKMLVLKPGEAVAAKLIAKVDERLAAK